MITQFQSWNYFLHTADELPRFSFSAKTYSYFRIWCMNAKCLHSSVVQQQMSVLNGCFTQQGALQPSAPDCRPNTQSTWHWEKVCELCFILSLWEAYCLPLWILYFDMEISETTNCIWVLKIIPWQNKSIKSFTKK